MICYSGFCQTISQLDPLSLGDFDRSMFAFWDEASPTWETTPSPAFAYSWPRKTKTDPWEVWAFPHRSQ